jgi:type I restriction enzyme S subunit
MITSEIKYSTLTRRLDSKYYKPEFLELDKWLDSLETVRISDLCDPSILRIAPTRKPNAIFKYIEIENVDQRTGYVTYQTFCGRDAPSRARKIVKNQNVIVSMTRPDKGTIGVVPKELDGGICSTGFCVLVPKLVDAISLFCLLKSNVTRKQLVRKTSASMYPTVSENDVLSVRMPSSYLGSSVLKEVSTIVKDSIEQQRQASEKLAEAFAHLEMAFQTK